MERSCCTQRNTSSIKEVRLSNIRPAWYRYILITSPFFILKFNLNFVIGKTCFLSYLLFRRLQERLPTIYRVDDRSCFLFDDHSKGEQISIDKLAHMPSAKKRMLWVLTDESLQSSSWYSSTSGWFVVLAASPCKLSQSKKWKSERNVHEYYMSNWEWSELYAAYWYKYLINTPWR